MEKYHDFVFFSWKMGCNSCISLQVYNKRFNCIVVFLTLSLLLSSADNLCKQF